MIYLLSTIHVIVCLLLVGLILLQHGKSADLAATFGGQGSETAFGPRGAATALSRGTTWLAIVWVISTLGLYVYTARHGSGGNGSKSVLAGSPTTGSGQTTAPAGSGSSGSTATQTSSGSGQPSATPAR